MKKRSNAYWAKRAVALEAEIQNNATAAAEEIKRIYKRAIKNINADIQAVFNEYARFNAIDEEVARELIDNAERDLQYKELKELLEEVKDDEELAAEVRQRINAQAYGARINRLEAVKTRIYVAIKKAGAAEAAKHKAVHDATIKRAYYTTITDTAKGIDCGIDFSLLNKRAIDKMQNKKWLGSNYSARIWNNNDSFINSLQRTIEDGITSGHSIERMARQLEEYVKDTGGSINYTTERLVRTETAHFMAEGQAAAYEEIGAESYRVVAALSERTCEVCGRLDGSEFRMSDRAPGINYPPIHPNCRCTTIAGGNLPKKRIARDPIDNSTYKVDGSVTHEQWKNGLTSEQKEAIEQNVKQRRKAAADRKQYERYKNVLGAENIPKTLDKFIDVKYNDGDKYAELKGWYRANNRYLQKKLNYILPTGEKNFIPEKAIFTNIKTIAGKSSPTVLRDRERLSCVYGGEKSEWKKRAGKIESSKYMFDVHWYELNGRQYEAKLVNRKDK